MWRRKPWIDHSSRGSWNSNEVPFGAWRGFELDPPQAQRLVKDPRSWEGPVSLDAPTLILVEATPKGRELYFKRPSN